jgi:integrase
MPWIHADQSKNKKAIGVPLNVDAINVLREQKGKHEKWVFPYNGKPVYQVSTKAWRKARERTGLEGFRFHDLRHNWASWQVQAGTPLNALQELGDWSSAEIVRRYAHLGANHLASYADNILEPSVPDSGTKLVQFKIVKN